MSGAGTEIHTDAYLGLPGTLQRKYRSLATYKRRTPVSHGSGPREVHTSPVGFGVGPRLCCALPRQQGQGAVWGLFKGTIPFTTVETSWSNHLQRPRLLTAIALWARTSTHGFQGDTDTQSRPVPLTSAGPETLPTTLVLKRTTYVRWTDVLSSTNYHTSSNMK